MKAVEALKPFFVFWSGWLLRALGGKGLSGGFLAGGFVSWVKAESCSRVPDVCLDAARRGFFFWAVEAFAHVFLCYALLGNPQFPLRVDVILPAERYSFPGALWRGWLRCLSLCGISLGKRSPWLLLPSPNAAAESVAVQSPHAPFKHYLSSFYFSVKWSWRKSIVLPCRHGALPSSTPFT